MAKEMIIGLTEWLKTPAGCYVLDWEQRHVDTVVADLFGFHALQLGLPELDALRANRMPHRWVVSESASAEQANDLDARRSEAVDPDHITAAAAAPAVPRIAVALHCDFDALPFDANSLDLVVLPHSLEMARDAHLALREIERVLVPEGRVVIVGFNPSSLWGLRQWFGHRPRWLGNPTQSRQYHPPAGEFMGYRRLRDWLRLLSFEVESSRFGCYRPPVRSQKWLSRFAWIERCGERWWPVFGAVYFVVAVKRVRGMRLVGLARAQGKVSHAAPAPVVATRHTNDTSENSR